MSTVLTGPDLDLDDAGDFIQAWSACEPTAHPRCLLWCEENVVTDLNRPYDHLKFPHIGAPGGPMDAFDDHAVREIVLQWASRLGKTFFGQVTTIYNGVVLRLNQIFGSSKEGLALQVVARTYKMLRNAAVLLLALTKPIRLQQQHLIEFFGCSVFVGWARSAATFADKDCHRGHANEFDDWDHLSTSKDGDPGDQFTERFKDHWGTRKVVFESIPKVRGKSRIEKRRKEGWQCEYHVPCPHCRKFQILEFGTKDSEHGIKWETTDGKVVAWYVCVHCHKRTENHHRAAMMRRGVWVPEGCTVNHEAAWAVNVRSLDYKWEGWSKASWIIGTPIKNNEIASYRLSSFVALSVTWDDIANSFLACKQMPQRLRNWKNQWEGHTWEIRKSRSEPDEIVKRIATDYPQMVVPEWAEFITLGVDRQRADGGFVVYRVLANGPEEMHLVIDFGTAEDLDKLWLAVGTRPYYKPDGSHPLYIEAGAVDSGWDPDTTYKFCKKNPTCMPCKGGNTASEKESYKWTEFEESKYNTEGLSLLLVSTNYTETALQHRLDTCTPCEPNGFGVCAEAARDPDLIADLANAVLADKVDARGEPALLWVKKDEATPNDGRDATRYGIEAGNAYRDQQLGTSGQDETTGSVTGGEKRPDGRDWNAV